MATFFPVATERDRGDRAILRMEPVDISAPGRKLSIEWNTAKGATKVEVESAALTLYPAVAEEIDPEANFRANGSGWVVDVPAGRRVRALGLNGFHLLDGDDLTNAPPPDMRIAVAFPAPQGGGFDSPRFSVPEVFQQGAVPPTLRGAAFSNKVLQLSPAVAARQVRISLVTGANPPEFQEQASQLETVQLVTHTAARNAKVLTPDGAPVWETPEFDPDADAAEIDLRQALEAALNEKLHAGKPLAVDFTVTADAPARSMVLFSGARGVLVRTQPGTVQTVLEGDPVALKLDASLPDEQPRSVTGDLTIHYHGIRILESASDPLPAANAALSGTIVRAQGAVRVLAPSALTGQQPARIGVFGRAPEACELAIEFVEVIGDTVGQTLSPPAVLKLEPSTALATHWAELHQDLTIDKPAGVRVRANTGRFFWAQQVVRVSIFDPEPGGRSLFLNSTLFAPVHESESHQPAFAFPAGVFRNAAPALVSDLFLTVEFSDLSLRYAR
jgi:hypothetical protein